MATTRDDLYRNDFYAWTQRQAAELRQLRGERVNTRLDLDNLAEEVESLGRSDLRRVKSQLRRIIEHLLKLHHSPASEPRDGWEATILDARQDIDDYLTLSMRTDIEAGLSQDYTKARAKAALALERYGEHEAALRLPASLPYSLAELLDPAFLPAGVAGSPEIPKP